MSVNITEKKYNVTFDHTQIYSLTCDRKVNVSSGFAVIVFSSLDDHQVSWKIDTPGQRTGGNQHLRVKSQGKNSTLYKTI